VILILSDDNRVITCVEGESDGVTNKQGQIPESQMEMRGEQFGSLAAT
jgi:hypothetical protein